MFSAQPAEQSTQASLTVGTIVGEVVVPDFSELPEEEQVAYAEGIEFPVRKAAHATEFAILGVLFTLMFATADVKCYFFGGWLTGTIYAMTDEFHQLFVPGRSGQLKDVVLDSVGCLLGCVLICLIWRHYLATRV